MLYTLFSFIRVIWFRKYGPKWLDLFSVTPSHGLTAYSALHARRVLTNNVPHLGSPPLKIFGFSRYEHFIFKPLDVCCHAIIFMLLRMIKNMLKNNANVLLGPI